MPASAAKLAGLIALGTLGPFLPLPALADQLASPNGEPILTISGEIESTNRGDAAVFDRAMLESMGVQSITTMTPWYDEPVTFEGVPLDELMEIVGANGDRVIAVALNDYTTEIPISDFEEHGTLLAFKRDGEFMSIRDKGPLFIVYPYDSKSELQDQLYYGRSAWQLYQLIVK